MVNRLLGYFLLYLFKLNDIENYVGVTQVITTYIVTQNELKWQ